MNLYIKDDMGKGSTYIAPDPSFVSTVALFASSLPWDKFRKFFEKKRLVNLSGNEQLILLRLVALQEFLTLDDDALLRWAKHQLYLFSFMQPDFQPKLPTVELYQQFREAFDNVGLLKPFRKQCQRLITEHESDQAYSNLTEKHSTNVIQNAKNAFVKKKLSNKKINLRDIPTSNEVKCPNCGSENIYILKPSQEASSLPNIQFSKCRFCGNTFRANRPQ